MLLLFAYSFVFVIIISLLNHSQSSSSIIKSFIHSPKSLPQPQLVLISGCTGTGKSTFGMSIALSQGILRCIATDSIRQVMRSFDHSPALHRSSYSGEGDAILNWKECCEVLSGSVDGLVDDAIKRGVSILIEGVHLIPSSNLIQKWQNAGGVAVGCVLYISEADAHRQLILRRGEITKKGAEQQVVAFNRIRAIQDEMIKLGKLNDWLIIEQKLEPDPIDIITKRLLDEQAH